MNRLTNISRAGGYPLCSEVLEVLNENSEMLKAFLEWLPLPNRTAVFFKGHEYMVVCESNHRNRIVKVGVVGTTDLSSAKLTFTTTSHSVTDSAGNTIDGVWTSETAAITSTNSNLDRWTFLEMSDVFGTKLWKDKTLNFGDGLSSCSITGNGYLFSIPELYGHNKLLVNDDTLKLHLHIRFRISPSNNTVLHIPFSNELGGYFRLNANLTVVDGGNYPLRAMINSNEMVFNIGRWIQDEGVTLSSGSMFDLVININDILELW